MTKNTKTTNLTIPLFVLSLIVFLHVFMFVVIGDCIIFNINSGITFMVWLVVIYLAINYKNNLFLLVPFVLLFMNEFMYVYFNVDVFDGPSRTQLFYDLTTRYFIKNEGNNTNLTEGIYLKDIHDHSSLMSEEESRQLSPQEANDNKFKKMFMFLGINPCEYKHLKILDMGCGNGDFIKYCKSVGIQATGMSISKEQVHYLKEQNLDVYQGSYRELQPQFIGKYDIVTFWGSLEHVTQAYPCSKYGEQKAEKVLHKITKHLKQYYRPDSDYKLLFTTTLHMNREVCKDKVNTYLLERAYGGWYFYDEPRETVADKIESIGFKKIKQDDFTYHYYMVTKIDPSHFGCPAKPNLYNVLAVSLGILVNAHLIPMSLYTLRGEWMWQFDNQLHLFDELCKNCTFEHDRSKRPTTLLWSVNKLS
jgi:cyclopropane fatty-acyl-phospholipid synthase-like methyltransferase